MITATLKAVKLQSFLATIFEQLPVTDVALSTSDLCLLGSGERAATYFYPKGGVNVIKRLGANAIADL